MRTKTSIRCRCCWQQRRTQKLTLVSFSLMAGNAYMNPPDLAVSSCSQCASVCANSPRFRVFWARPVCMLNVSLLTSVQNPYRRPACGFWSRCRYFGYQPVGSQCELYGTQGFGTVSDDLYVPYEKKNCYALRRLFPQQILASRGFYIYLPVSKSNFTSGAASRLALTGVVDCEPCTYEILRNPAGSSHVRD